MKAVNLIPAEHRRALGSLSGMRLPVYAFIALLAGALVMVTITVLTDNKIAARKAQLSSLQAEVSTKQSVAAELGDYATFVAVAGERVDTVRAIAATRFDWHIVLSQLAQVVPANASLLSLTGTVAPGASAGGGSSGSSSSLRSDLPGPAIELAGCAAGQDEVARLMSRLGLIEGAIRVTLGSAVKAASGSGSASSSAAGCTDGQSAFDLVVFFAPVPDAGPTGAEAAGGAQGVAG
jgi:Tfp pilus assembly protein PilN